MNWLAIIIILMIIGGIITAVQNLSAKTKIAMNKDNDPEKAVDAAEEAYYNDAMSLEGYESQLVKIAESSQSPEVMRKLVEFYTETKKNEQKAQYWSKRAIQCGDIEAMMNFYGFTAYDVSYSDYTEILTSLNNIKDTSNETVFAVNYCKGIVYYKTGEIGQAKQMFLSCKKIGAETQSISSNGEFENDCNYMLLLCYYKERNIDEVRKIVATLVKNNFKIPAKDYLNIYNYYVEKRSDGNPNFGIEIIYAEAYAKCEDADRQKAYQICGDSYYNSAQSYEMGINGLEKDLKKAVEGYEHAAEYEHAEALYYIGIHSWIADNHIRDYFKANNYLLKAESKGHKKASEFLSQYGVDKILVLPVKAEKTTYTFMDDHQLTVSAEIMKWLHIYAGVRYSKDYISKMFFDSYSRNIKSFDDLITNIHQLYADHIALMVQWSISLLMYFGIDTYSTQDIIDMSGDLSLLPQVPLFEQGIIIIDNRANELNLKTAYSQATRTQWSGSGFGTTISGTIKAGIKASIAAGAMNIGSDILHGIGDSIVASMNNSEIKKMKKELFEKKSTKQEFYKAVRSACFKIGDVVLQILEKNCDIEIRPLEGNILFGDEILKSINDKTLDAKIANNTAAKKYEYSYALLVEKLRRRPLDDETLKLIFTLSVLRNQALNKNEIVESILRYSGDFMIDLSDVSNDLEKRLNLAEPQTVPQS